jgi:chromosome segregation protein
MYLKTIDIVGFKSFAEKTRVDLKPGITGVIGPNGCGKSNIMESIRWCIGEMSWKSLRSDSMVSIIFAGTARRSAMNLCEVTLTFDNAESKLPVQYSEVQVTRRIYRSGESEYYINKTQCRLRDIRELFLDTGIGNTGYAIIDQGGVDFVLNSKPEDRRSLFEEAAGVSKYKAKRQEALRKMDRVEIDLGRLQDSVALINEQIKKLDADARKANLYQKYKTELVAMEAGQILREVAEIDTDSKAEAERIEPQTRRLSELHSSVEADEARASAMELERTAQEKSVIEANQKVSQRKSEIGRLEERRENAKHTTIDLQSQIAMSKQEVERESLRLEELTPKIQEALRELEAVESKYGQAKAECDAFASEFSALEEQLREAQARRQAISENLLAAVERSQQTSRVLSDCERRIGQSEFEIGRTRKEHEKKTARTQAMRSVCAQAEDALAGQKRIVDESREGLAGAEAALAQARRSIEDLSERLMDKHAAISSQKAKIEALEIQGQRDPYWVGAHAVVNAQIPGILGTVRSLIELEDPTRSQVEDLLGERLYSVVCSDLTAAKAGIEFLKGSGKGRARFLVMSALPEASVESSHLPAQAKPLLASLRFSPEHDKVVRYLLGEAYTLEGGLFGRYWVCGGAGESAAQQLSLSDIGVLKERLAALEAEHAAVVAEKKTCEDSLDGLKSAIKAAQEDYHVKSGEAHKLEAEQVQRRASLSSDEEELSILSEEEARISEEITQVKSRQVEQAALLEEIRAKETALRAEEAEASAAYSECKDKVVAKRVEKDHLDKTLESVAQQKDFLAEQKARVEADKDALTRSVQRRSEQQENWEGRIRELTALDDQSKARLEELHVELAQLEQESASLFEALQKIQLDMQALSESLRERKISTDHLQQELHAAEMKLSQFSTRRGYLVARLQQEWDLTYDDAKEKYKDQPVDSERVEFLRRRIASLGNVNMAAPEEYEELTTKRDSLQGQIDDLLSAKQDLHSVIAKINATTRENFRQTFTEVREHFRKLYGTLFEGGEADVILIDKENMLESGVDIVAQPPGKKLQSISQLSGGEKTLTAIALLFAFFMVRPSPMCMLDEADAALDDANVERFVAMIREFREKTQFLIVSHNKLTMEACDAIYGVTMEESGVSQLISVDFKKADTDKPGRSSEPADSQVSTS